MQTRISLVDEHKYYKKKCPSQFLTLLGHSHPLSLLSDSNDCNEGKSSKDKTISTTKYSASKFFNKHTIPPFILIPYLQHTCANLYLQHAYADPSVLCLKHPAPPLTLPSSLESQEYENLSNDSNSNNGNDSNTEINSVIDLSSQSNKLK